MHHTFSTDGNEDGSLWTRLKPKYVTAGYFADFIGQDLTLVEKDSNLADTLGKSRSARGFAGGGYLGLDWK